MKEQKRINQLVYAKDKGPSKKKNLKKLKRALLVDDPKMEHNKKKIKKISDRHHGGVEMYMYQTPACQRNCTCLKKNPKKSYSYTVLELSREQKPPTTPKLRVSPKSLV